MKRIIALCMFIMALIAVLAGCEPAHQHEFGEWTTVKDATCEEAGERVRVCSCGEKDSEKIPATGHTEVIDAAVDAGCTESGFTEGKHCSVCNKIFVAQEIIPAKGHTEGREVLKNIVTPTCTTTGSSEVSVYCSVCDKEYDTKTTVIEATGHSYDLIVTDPTCTAPGAALYDCTKCEHKYTETINALGHSEVVDEGREATCSATGLTEGKHCSVCNEVLVAQSEIPLIPHTYDDKYDESCNECGFIRDAECAHINTQSLPAKEASCLESGLTEGKVCEKCQEIIVPQQIIPAKGHTEVIDAAVTPTCESTGLTEGKHCSVCGEVIVAQSEIEKINHDYQNKICINCGQAYFSEGLEYVSVGDETCYVSGIGKCSDTEIIIPAVSPDGFRVIGIESEAFYACNTITSITIPTSISYIGAYAFFDCYSITEVHISDLEAWCLIAFNHYSTPLQGEAKLYLNNELVKHVIIPDSITEIKDYVFSGCSSLESIELHNNVSSIGTCAFRNCSSLTAISIPDSVTNIGSEAFSHCFKLKVIKLSSGITSINTETFFNCWALESIDIPDSVTVIDNNAFYACSALESITIPNNVTSIGYRAFDWCNKLKSIIIPNSVKTIGEGALGNCGLLTEIYYIGTEEQWTTITIHGSNDSLTNATLYYYSDAEPTNVGNYWHYVDGIITVWPEFEPECTHENITTIPATEATCTKTGLTEGKHCSVCNKVLVAQEIVAALGHTEVIDAAVTPTCESTGLSEGKHCSVCNKVLVAQEIVAALGHTEVIDAAVTPTCENTGLSEGKHCSVCNKVLVAQEIVAALGHTKTVIPGIVPTCSMSGSTDGEYCSVCDTFIKEQEYLAPVDHRYVNHVCEFCGIDDPDHYFVMTIPEAIDAADGKKIAVSGTVCTINTIWSEANQNMSVTLTDGEGNQLYVYSLATEVALGDVITVNGTISTYNGQRQIAKGATATIDGHNSGYDYTEMTIDEALLAADNTNVIVSGIVVEIAISYDSGYNNMSVYISTNGGSRLYVYRLQGEVTNGDVITIKGSMATYNGQRQITGGTFEKTGEHDCFDVAPASCQNGPYCRFCGKSHGEPYDHKDTYDANNLCDYGCGTVVPPAANSTLTIEKALYIGGLLNHNVFTTGKYYITGKITSIANTAYGNMYIEDGNGNEIYIYGFYNADGSARFDAMEDQPAVGDMVTVYAVIGNYNGAQIKNAQMTARYPAVEGSVGLSYSLNDDGQSYTLTGRGVCTDNEIVIPELYNGYPVTHIGTDAFWNDEIITSVVIPESITELGTYTFFSPNLASVTILSNSITTLPSRTFAYTKITSIELPASLKVIDRYAFQGCYYLETITIPATLESIGTEAFDGCPLTTVYYGGSESDWANISIVDYCNDAIKNATKVYYYIPEE